MSVFVAPTRQRLLDAARSVVEERGYGGASVVAIAERAGVASGTLYRHFPSKAELFVEVFRDVCEREIASATRAARSVEAAVDKLDAVLANFARRALANPVLAWSLIAEPVDPAVEQIRLDYRRTYTRHVERLLRAAIRQGSAPPQDTAIAAAALVGAGNEVLAGPLSPLAGTRRDTARSIDALRTVCQRAIGAA
ncbi:TetR/AcrR family transcriptional regulator [Conexibacter sp. CPCC 206217]|uniref:TetR/AcrR family transcriptional regulator n=1 Tax=Conexibacter sp. CPCC 206217 TaxID=3064574 RepID=UPI00271CD088|nr:TetR/AcrR family transcriptional regulator [Conexibacter sp. CPCC 206217]MDO8211681.1 TetR/AcrR family transcriptional regulator [Conexibacter sp. CPCC 206217]